MARSKFWNFNLTEEDVQKISAYQGHVCALCSQNLTKKGKPLKLMIDHDHTSGLVRGLLCFRCNTQLGSLAVYFVKKILAYLSNPPATQALGSPRFGLVGRVGTKKQRKLYRKLQKNETKEKPI
jgi:Recombination endonuclease VII